MSSRIPSLLLPLCLLSAVALNVYPLIDPTGVYGSYLSKLDKKTPPVAAVALAAADGVYPWSEPKAPEPEPVPDPEPLPDPEPKPEPEPEPEPEEPASPFTAVDASYFDDALFIGDSHTDGFKDYAGLPNADYLCHNGLTVWSAVEKAEFPGRQTLAQALRGKHYGKIYLMLGINELGTGTAESWAAQYKVLLDEIRELQPDAIIFLQAIFHTTQEKSDTTFFKNSTIDARNAEIEKFADNETVFYIDCIPAFDDDSGALTPEFSGDGVHVKAPYYVMWRDYLFEFGVVR